MGGREREIEVEIEGTFLKLKGRRNKYISIFRRSSLKAPSLNCSELFKVFLHFQQVDEVKNKNDL